MIPAPASGLPAWVFSFNRLNVLDLSSELLFKTSRSSGKGGQNVNKVSTKVELRFNIPASLILTDSQKRIVLEKLKNRITLNGDLVVTSSAGRSQLGNRKKAFERIHMLVEKALVPEKDRIPTKKTRTSVHERLASKKLQSDRKATRKRIEPED
jgi:ribosome-associated protein